MLRKFLCVAALAAFAVPAQAGILSNLLTFNSQEDTLIDQSVDGIFDTDSNGIDVGDVLYGIAQIDQVQPDGGTSINTPPDAIAIAVAAKITNVSGTLTGVGLESLDLTFGVSDAAGLTLNDLLGPGADVTAAGSVFGVFEQKDAPKDPIDYLNDDSGAAPTGLANLSAANGWKYVASGGLKGTNDNGDADFFEASLIFNNGVLLTGVQRGGFSILDDTFGPSVSYLPVSIDNIAGTSTTGHDIVILPGSTISAANTPFSTNGWDYENNASYRLNAVPEPASFAVWSLILVGGAASKRRRRK